MTDRTALACSRLAVVAGLGALLLILACRPAWSPDGTRLLFQSRVGLNQVGVALYDRETGEASLLADRPAEDDLAALAWTPDGRRAVVVTRSEADKRLRVALHSVPRTGEPRTFDLPVHDELSTFVIPPVVVGKYLFVAGGQISRLDLQSGEVEQLAAGAGRQLAIAPRGDGLCYVALSKEDEPRGWEIGRLDPETLAMTPIVTAPADSEWQPIPLPAFSPGLDRIAMPARKAGEKQIQALLVFADGELETLLPLEDDETVGISSVHWARDGVTLLVGMCRRDPENGTDSFCLYETTFSGSVTRQTTILTLPRHKENEAPGFLFPMALSPDGRFAAFSTAMIEHADGDAAGLYLVDLDSKEREVRHVEFPARKD